MKIIVNTLPNASANVNGIEFVRNAETGFMHSLHAVEGEALAVFEKIPGFKLLEHAFEKLTHHAVAAAEPVAATLAPAGEAAAPAEVAQPDAAADASAPAVTGTVSADGAGEAAPAPAPAKTGKAAKK